MRHEIKYRISYEDFMIMKSRIEKIAEYDRHTDEKGVYTIHSLYFDNIADKALREKLDGIGQREKFRIRYYNEDTSYIRLEKKSKIYNLCEKQSAALKKEEAEKICEGDIAFLLQSGQPLLQELYAKMKYQLLRPRCIVEYDRTPYVYKAGNVRVTFDRNIRTGLYHNRLFDRDIATVPAEDGTIILEIKYDAFIPEVIDKMLRVSDRRAAAFGKYAVCRRYG